MKFKVGLVWALLSVALAGCTGAPPVTAGGVGNSKQKPKLAKLITEDTKVGAGPTAEVGDTVIMQYRGTTADDKEFDSNVPENPDNPTKAPFTFQLVNGHAQAIDGWNKGILGMKVGGERKLSIPWSMAYGEAGKSPTIPPQADLYFDVKLLGIVKAGQEGNYGVSDLKKGAGPAVKSGNWVTITYKAKLLNNMPVDESSTRKNGTLQFQAGTGDIGGGDFVPIKGVVFGVVGMQAGGERLLTLPPALASNPTGPPDPKIAGNSVRFDVKLLRVLDKKGPEMQAPKP